MRQCLEILVDDPFTDDINAVHQPYAAFNQGFDAKQAGYAKEKNPYPPGQNRRWWNLGYEEATA